MMAKYYAFCEKHGMLSKKYSKPETPEKLANEHLLTVAPPHGKVAVIEEYETATYGQYVPRVRIHKIIHRD